MGSPTGTTSARAASFSPSPARSFDDDTFPESVIPDVLATDGRFLTFLRMLDLHDPSLLSFLTISHETGTVFAPTDHAFDALPSPVVDALLRRENTFAVRAVIAAHLLPYVLRTDRFETGPLPMGDDGQPVLQVEVEGDTVRIDGVEVIEDLRAVNGVVHVVDGVLGLGRVELELQGTS
jgi:uncharacterized surface protein with fasciclin (FAS1) repeats